MKWFNNQKIAVKVFITAFIFILFIAGISFQGIVSMNKAEATFETFFADRFVPMRKLNILFKGILQVRVNMLVEKISVKMGNTAEFEKRMASSKKNT